MYENQTTSNWKFDIKHMPKPSKAKVQSLMHFKEIILFYLIEIKGHHVSIVKVICMNTILSFFLYPVFTLSVSELCIDLHYFFQFIENFTQCILNSFIPQFLTDYFPLLSSHHFVSSGSFLNFTESDLCCHQWSMVHITGPMQTINDNYLSLSQEQLLLITPQ